MLDDPQIRIAIIFLGAVLLILLPFAVYRQISRDAQSWGKLLDAARHPFKREDQELNELGQRVEQLQRDKER